MLEIGQGLECMGASLGSSAWARQSDVAGRARRGCEPGVGHVLAGWAGGDTCGRPWAGHERAGRAGATRAADNWRAYSAAPESILSPSRRGACGAVATMIVGATERAREGPSRWSDHESYADPVGRACIHCGASWR